MVRCAVVDAAAATVEVDVVDPAGRPVAGATVGSNLGPHTTGCDGHVVLATDGLSEGAAERMRDRQKAVQASLDTQLVALAERAP